MSKDEQDMLKVMRPILEQMLNDSTERMDPATKMDFDDYKNNHDEVKEVIKKHTANYLADPSNILLLQLIPKEAFVEFAVHSFLLSALIHRVGVENADILLDQY